MTAVEPATIAQEWHTAQQNGHWKPKAGDVLHDCEFVRAGFQAWALEAPDKSWKLTLSRIDFGGSDPSAILTVNAPDHEAAFGDLDWLVFSRTIPVNGGTRLTNCAKECSRQLGGTDSDWTRRIDYLIARSRQANAGASNGTFSTSVAPAVTKQPPFVFAGRIREGRTISIFGPGSAGKTTFVDGLIVAACSGVEIVPDWRPSRIYRCLVLDWDEGREEEEVRLSAICTAYGIGLPGGYHYKRMSRPLHDVADEVGAYIVTNEIELVVVSPVGRATRDHGDNITAPIDELYEMLRSFATTNILIDHVPGSALKGGAEREYGSVRKRDNVRGSYSLYAQSETVGQRVLVLRNTKPDALLPKQAPAAIRVEYQPADPVDGMYQRISYHRDIVQDESGPAVVYVERPETQPEKMARILREHGPLTITGLCALSGFDNARVKDIAREARKRGFWILFEHGVYSLSTDERDSGGNGGNPL